MRSHFKITRRMSKTNQANPSTGKQKELLATTAIRQLVESGLSFALFRKPDADDVELILQKEGDPMVVKPEDTSLTGFIFAPFSECKQRPTLLIRPDIYVTGWEDIACVAKELPREKHVKLNQLDHSRSEFQPVSESQFYNERFHTILSQIANERFEKLVLSYCEQSYRYSIEKNEPQVFLKSLEKYPNAMVYLTYTPIAGRWIGATPELLLQREEDQWHTVALAGTHAWGDGEWDTKNIHEQDVVRRYINETLDEQGATCHDTKRSIMQIGPLMHIRTDFSFTFSTPRNTLDVARRLHPTPAVCGYPKEEAFRYLNKCEKACRNYFSGYLGVLEGNKSAHLYVNLRCAQIGKDATYYHAGGGITALSLLWEEKREIERKTQTLKSLL